jgi:hypothetical protein
MVNPRESGVVSDPIRPDGQLLSAILPMLDGYKISGETDSWIFSNLNSPTMLELISADGTAVYGFEIDATPDSVIFQNYHREAQTGYGTKTLKQIEETFRGLGLSTKRKVRIIFPKFNQEDTAKWLEKNNYLAFEQEEQQYYYKDLLMN